MTVKITLEYDSTRYCRSIMVRASPSTPHSVLQRAKVSLIWPKPALALTFGWSHNDGHAVTVRSTLDPDPTLHLRTKAHAEGGKYLWWTQLKGNVV